VSNLVDFIPLLQKVPNPMHTRGKELHKGLVDTYGGIIKEIEGKLKSGIQVDDCLAKSLIQLRHEENLDDLDLAIMASAFLIGGVETVSLSASALNPP
jgi:cytochrome P450